MIQERLDLQWGKDKVTFIEYRDKKIIFSCNSCGEIQEVFNNNLSKRKTWCKKCYNSKAKTHETFIDQMNKIDSSIKILETYINDNTKIKVQHLICGNIWASTPSNLLRGKGCPEKDCMQRKRMKNTLEKTDGVYSHTSKIPEVINKHRTSAGKPELTKLYIDVTKTKESFVRFLEEIPFDLRSYEYVANLLECPNSTVRSQIATNFNVQHMFNKTEKSNWQVEIQNFIKLLGFEIEINKRKYLDGLEIDIFIPERAIGIECNGIATHCSDYPIREIFGTKDKNYHLNKTYKASLKGIRLIHIFEDEWKLKKDLIKDKITNILNKTNNTIYARKCRMITPTAVEIREFLNANHIQGFGQYGRYRRALTFKGKIVAMMILGSNFRSFSYDTIELTRYTSVLDTSVVGGFSRLLKDLSKEAFENGYQYIQSFADLCWVSSIDNIYSKTGWKEVSQSSPDYFYCNPLTFERKHKSAFQKSKIKTMYPKVYDDNKTERQMMSEIKEWAKIYDCGKKLYLLEI